MASKARAALLLTLSGCGMISGIDLAPTYERPAMPVPETWRTDMDGATQANSAGESPSQQGTISVDWWKAFEDPVLTASVEAALQGNQELLFASASVDEFLARLGVVHSAEYPAVDLSGSLSRTRRSLGGFSGGPSSATRTSNSASIGADVSWELDLWGRLRNATESARQQLLAQESVRRGVMLSLVSSVATTYVRLREADRLLEISHETVTSREEALEIVRSRYVSGLTSELDVRQAESELATARATIPRFEAAVMAGENLLSVLQGRSPDAMPRGRTLPELADVRAVPSGLPSSLLENRPDIARAEEELKSANAQIGVARAEYFPKLDLTGLFGYASSDLDRWLDGQSRTWSLGGSLLGPIWNAGRTKNQVLIAEAGRDEAIAVYRQTILTAFREVEDALASYRSFREELAIRTGQVSALRSYLELAQTRYSGGQSSFLEVLDAQRSLFLAQIEMAQVQALTTIALIDLYRVLGGGWPKA